MCAIQRGGPLQPSLLAGREAKAQLTVILASRPYSLGES